MSKVNHRKETLETWSERITQWKASELTAIAWCKEHQINYKLFLLWKRRLINANFSRDEFVELKESPNKESGIILEVSEIRIHLHSNFDPIALQNCLKVLSSSKC